MKNKGNEHIIAQIKHRFSITGSAAITPHDNGILCFLPIYPDAGCSFMLFVDDGLSDSNVRITDYGSCYENAFHFCNAAQECELKIRISECRDTLTMEKLPDGSWYLYTLLDDDDSPDDINHILDIFDAVFSVTDSFIKEIFDDTNTIANLPQD